MFLENLNRREFLTNCFLLSVVPKMPLVNFNLWFSGTDDRAHEAMHYEKLDENQQVWCQLCFRKCIIDDKRRGFCRNRENRKGTLYALTYPKPCSLQIDPIEKEPAFHMLPGTYIFCVAAAGCNLRCKFCQNWQISQQKVEDTKNYNLLPDDIAKLAKEKKCHGVSFTYSEPTAFYEYMLDVAKAAKKRGLRTLFHTNGTMTQQPLFELLEVMDAVTVDLKGFNNKFYHAIATGELEPVLKTLENIKNKGKHLEIVNLIVTTLNDDMGDIKRMCAWIKENLGREVPIHFNRFFPSHKLKNLPPTPMETLEEAYKIARAEGLQYIYIGNMPGHKHNSTFCPECEKRLIHRVHFGVLSNNIKDGKCKFCKHEIPGIWA